MGVKQGQVFASDGAESNNLAIASEEDGAYFDFFLDLGMDIGLGTPIDSKGDRLVELGRPMGTLFSIPLSQLLEGSFYSGLGEENLQVA
jgi:hypothetical protein